MSLTFLQRQHGLQGAVSWMAEIVFGLKKLFARESFTPWACPFLLQVSSSVNTADPYDEWDEPFGSTGSPLRNSTQPDTS